MYDCARSLRDSKVPINLNPNSPERRRDASGMDLSGSDMEDTKDNFNLDKPDDLPDPGVPMSEEPFLYGWWCIFWDMFSAQRGQNRDGVIKRYQEFNQVGCALQLWVDNANVTQAKSRQQQEHQAAMLRNISQMGGPQGVTMRGPNGTPMTQPNDLIRKAVQNHGGRNMYVT